METSIIELQRAVQRHNRGRLLLIGALLFTLVGSVAFIARSAALENTLIFGPMSRALFLKHPFLWSVVDGFFSWPALAQSFLLVLIGTLAYGAYHTRHYHKKSPRLKEQLAIAANRRLQADIDRHW